VSFFSEKRERNGARGANKRENSGAKVAILKFFGE
jgi:hypothetical protein